MRSPEDKLYAAWCRRGDSKALAALFDACAPRLLRMALHLVGEASEAEDHVQQCFLVLIERRDQLDPRRPLWPWLATVLRYRVSNAKRQRGRTVDLDRLLETSLGTEIEDAAAPLERRELSAELARALDALAEPYRSAMVLRMRHGLAVADIAHSLDRSPATVRVQLHRGRELMRRGLPAGLASSLLLSLASDARGLDRVRTELLRQAGFASPLATLTWLGTSMMQYKTGIAVAGALLALVWIAPWQRPAGAAVDPVAARSDATIAPVGVVAPVGEASTPERARVATAEPTATEVLRGRVVERGTGEPIAGARVQLFEPRRAELLESVRAHPELWEIDVHGLPRARSSGDWPRLGPLDPAARFGRGEVEVFDWPAGGATPLAEATTDADGRFELPARSGLIVCRHADFGARAAVAPSEGGDEIVLGLHRFRTIHGQVTTADLSPPGVPLELCAAGRQAPPAKPRNIRSASTSADGAARPLNAVASVELEGLDAWRTPVGLDGRFELRVAADDLQFSVLTPGWKVERTARMLGDQPDQHRVIVVPSPILRFVDARSGAPIERVRLLGRDQRNGYVHWSGEYSAPGGELELPGNSWVLTAWNDGRDMAFTAWAEGYREARLTIEELGVGGVHEFALEPGAPSELVGRVRRGSEPVRGARVALIGHSPLQWDAEEDCLVDGARTDGGGNFRVSAAPGKWILRVEDEGQQYFEVVGLPSEWPLDLDLNQLGTIEVRLHDEHGEPRVDHVVALGGADGWHGRLATDANGFLAFEGLAPQRYDFFTTAVGSGGSMRGGLIDPIDLQRGETRVIELEIPSDAARLRVRVTGASVGSSWRIDRRPWVALDGSGSIEVDRSPSCWAFEVEEPGGRRTKQFVEQLEPELLVDVRSGVGRYDGRLVDPEGRSFAGWRVVANPMGGIERAPVHSVPLDADGSFTLDRLATVPHGLSFEAPETKHHYDDSTLTFYPVRAAGSAAFLRIDLPDPDRARVRLRGRVTRGTAHEPMAEAYLIVANFLATEQGRFVLARSLTRSDGDGRFSVEVPEDCERELSVYEEWSPAGKRLEQPLEADAQARELEIHVP